MEAQLPKPPSKTEVVPDPRNDRQQRRRFSAEAKRRILEEADACSGRGALAGLLRREGLYSSHLSSWRAQLARDGDRGLAPKRAGRKPVKDAKDRRIEHLERRNAKLERKLEISRKVIDLQLKAHEVLGIALPRIEDE